METMEQSPMTHWDSSRLHFEFPLEKRELRYKQLVLYIADQCVDDPTFSRLKLQKILFYSDFESFGRYGAPITGMPYRKFPFGPAPAAFGRYEEEMQQEGLIRIIRKQVHDYSRQRVLPLQDPNFDLFLAREIAVVGEWIRFFWGKTAREISRRSHGRPWKLAQDAELIPYEAVFVSNDPVSLEDVARVKELAARYKWPH
jgi:hypothetical protein